MTREGTRADAVKQGATHSDTKGIREWIQGVTARADLPVVTFDTRVHVKLLLGSAAKQAASALTRHGSDRAERGETFWVEHIAGPPADGERDRAREWGAELARRYATTA